MAKADIEMALEALNDYRKWFDLNDEYEREKVERIEKAINYFKRETI